MGRATKLVNKRYANIGEVTITFNDDSTEKRTITSTDSGQGSSPSVGTYFDSNSSRVPVQIEVLGNVWAVNELPQSIKYPNDVDGEVSYSEIPGDVLITPYGVFWMDE